MHDNEYSPPPKLTIRVRKTISRTHTYVHTSHRSHSYSSSRQSTAVYSTPYHNRDGRKYKPLLVMGIKTKRFLHFRPGVYTCQVRSNAVLEMLYKDCAQTPPSRANKARARKNCRVKHRSNPDTKKQKTHTHTPSTITGGHSKQDLRYAQKPIYIDAFFLTMFGPIYYGPP